MRRTIKELTEYAAARTLLFAFAAMPRNMAYGAAGILAALGFHLARRQRRAGLHNLQMAFPEKSVFEREQILRGCFRNLARLLVEFTHFPELNKGNISEYVVHDGLDNYLEGLRRGRGVVFMTAHFGAWEMSSFAHALYGYPLKFVVRPIDNRRVESE